MNAAGGLLGKKVNVIFEDDESDAGKAVNAFTKLVTQDKVNVVLGSSLSGTTMAMAPLAQAQKVILISTTGTNAKLTDPGKFIFRACFIDPFQGVVGANFSYDTIGARKAAILYDAGSDFNTGCAEIFREQFIKRGGEVVAYEAYQTGDVDFAAQATIIAKSGLTDKDVVYLPNYYNDVNLQARALRDQGVKCTLFGPESWPNIENFARPDIIPAYWDTGFARDTTDPLGAKFVKDFESKNPSMQADQHAALGYDAFHIVVDGIKRAGTLTDSDKIADGMAATNGDYVTGHITYDSHRDPVKSAVILEIKMVDGKLANVYHSMANP
jgi:branched-chain amino acid transport system substrate-binding protein